MTSSILSQAGSSLLAPNRNLYSSNSPPKEQTVKYLISNGEVQDNDANSQYLRFKQKLPTSYNDYYYSQTPNSTVEYAKMLDAQIQQKKQFYGIQKDNKGVDRNLAKPNNINPHTIPEPVDPPSFGFNTGLNSTTGYDTLFNPKLDLQRTRPQNITQQPIFGQSRGSNLMTPQVGVTQMKQFGVSRNSQEDNSNFFDKWNNYDSSYNKQPVPRGILRKENMNEQQMREKERNQQDLNQALQEQVLLKKQRKEAEERQLRIEDMLLNQRIKADQLQRQEVYSQQQSQQNQQIQSQYAQQQQNSLKLQQQQNQPIKTVHSKAEVLQMKNNALKKQEKDESSKNPFEETKELPRTPTGTTRRRDYSIQKQNELKNQVSLENIGQQTDRTEPIKSMKNVVATPPSFHPIPPQRNIKSNASSVILQPNQIRNNNDYSKDYQDFQNKMFSRQMQTLHKEVLVLNEYRSQVFKDMLQLRERSRQQHLLNLMNPTDVIEANRYVAAQRKQNLFNFHQLDELSSNPKGIFGQQINYLNPPGYTFDMLYKEKEKQAFFNNNEQSNYLLQKGRKSFAKNQQEEISFVGKKVQNEQKRAYSAGYKPKDQNQEQNLEIEKQGNEFLEQSEINNEEEQKKDDNNSIVAKKRTNSAHGYREGEIDTEQFIAEIFKQKKLEEEKKISKDQNKVQPPEINKSVELKSQIDGNAKNQKKIDPKKDQQQTLSQSVPLNKKGSMELNSFQQNSFLSNESNVQNQQDQQLLHKQQQPQQQSIVKPTPKNKNESKLWDEGSQESDIDGKMKLEGYLAEIESLINNGRKNNSIQQKEEKRIEEKNEQLRKSEKQSLQPEKSEYKQKQQKVIIEEDSDGEFNNEEKDNSNRHHTKDVVFEDKQNNNKKQNFSLAGSEVVSRMEDSFPRSQLKQSNIQKYNSNLGESQLAKSQYIESEQSIDLDEDDLLSKNKKPNQSQKDIKRTNSPPLTLFSKSLQNIDSMLLEFKKDKRN